jgi:carboxypeptidase C (cathepsin A)
LDGVAIGNGWVDPFYQLPAHNQFAIETNLINAGRGFLLSIGYKLCEFMMLTEIPILSQSVCYLAELAISGNPIYPSFNLFDIREECNHPLTCVDNYNLALFLNNGPLKKVLRPMGQWDECDNIVRAVMIFYAQYNYGHYLQTLLENDIAVLVYNGDKDYMANWMGAQAWTEALPWRYQEEFIQETFVDWHTNNKTKIPGGQIKSYQLLTLFKIYNAGKMVPKD